jgi:hypothetical protein
VNDLGGEVAVEDAPRGAIEHDDDAMLISYFSNSIPRFLNFIEQAIYSLQIHTIQSGKGSSPFQNPSISSFSAF